MMQSRFVDKRQINRIVQKGEFFSNFLFHSGSQIGKPR